LIIQTDSVVGELSGVVFGSYGDHLDRPLKSHRLTVDFDNNRCVVDAAKLINDRSEFSLRGGGGKCCLALIIKEDLDIDFFGAANPTIFQIERDDEYRICMAMRDRRPDENHQGDDSSPNFSSWVLRLH